MAIKSSTGLAAHLMVTGSAKEAFDNGFIKVYSGTEPATADAAVTGDLLMEFPPEFLSYWRTAIVLPNEAIDINSQLLDLPRV